MIGAYRETVRVTLDEFQRRRFVEFGRRSIQLLDPKSPRALAED